MSGREFTVLVNDALKRQLDGFDRSELARVREKFEFLASGLWDSGLRVKKLKGPAASVVFEARLSKGDRLLFTLGRDRGRSVVYAWSIESHDDVNRAKRSVLPENAPFLAFEPLSVEEREDLVIDDLPPDYFTQGSFDGIEDEGSGPQRWRVLDDSDWKRLIDSSDRQKTDLRLYLTEEQRAVLEQPPPLFLSGTAGSGKTTIAVYYLFRPIPNGSRRLFVTNHPYLCAYSERLYDGLASGIAAPAAQVRPRFAPYREIVREIVENDPGKGSRPFDPAREVDYPAFERMLHDRREFSSLDPELAWEEIRGIIKGSKPALNLGRYRDLVARYESGLISRRETSELEDILGTIEDFDFMPRIESIIDKKTSFADYGDFLRFHAAGRQIDRSAAVFVHSHIAECLERKAADLGKPLLSFPEYQALGKKRAPRFASGRAAIYAAAEWYQSRLREDGLWDEIDLTRRAIDVLAKGAGTKGGFEPWDLIVCDEAQDFTNIHVFLLFRLVADPASVVMAGDVKQIINPSGFRWSDLRALFWERGLKAPDLFRLSLNFRSVGGIVALGNALLDLKKRLADIQSDETKEAWKFRGKSPCLLSGIDEKSVVDRLSGAGAGSAIVVRDAEARERVKALARSELVFTVIESKGLEFESVLLWKLTPAAGDISALWRRIAGDDRLAKDNEARIVHEINLYYVAVTRARTSLVVYEDNLDFWNQGEFAHLYIRSSDPEILDDSWRAISTPDEWRTQGDYYFEREYWHAAAECYKNADDEARASLARGLGLFAERKFAEAAGLLETAAGRLETAPGLLNTATGLLNTATGLIGSANVHAISRSGLLEKAAVAYEESGNFKKAVVLWEASGNGERGRSSLARSLEKARDFAAAAAIWLELGDKKTALRDLERSEDPAALGELCRAMKLWEKAANAFAKCGRHVEEAECWRKAKNQGKAAEAYFAAKDWETAARYFNLSRLYARIPDCWLKAGRYDKAATSYLELREPKKAIDALVRWTQADPAAAATLRDEAAALEAKKTMHAAVRYAALGERASAGRLFMERGQYDLALAEYRAAGDHEKAAVCLERQNDCYGAALEIELCSPDSPRVAQLLERHVTKGIYNGEVDRKLGNKLNDEAHALDIRGELGKAANRYVAIGNLEEAYDCLLDLDRDDQAFELFRKYQAFDELSAFIRDKKNFSLSHEAVMRRADLLTETRFSPYFTRIWPYLLDALGRCRGEADLEIPEFGEELAALLPLKDLAVYKTLADMKHLGALDFLIRIGHMNGLFLLWQNAVRSMSESSAYFGEFTRKIENAASAEGSSAAWFRAFLDLMRGEAKSKALDLAGLKPWNDLFYSVGTRNIGEVIAWHHQRGNEPEFEAYGKYLGLEGLIAADFETRDDFANAAIWFERAKQWKDAFVCYHKAGNEAGSARMCEKLGFFHQALEVWNKLGTAKDIRRVEKAIASGKSVKAQAGSRRGKADAIEGKQLELL